MIGGWVGRVVRVASKHVYPRAERVVLVLYSTYSTYDTGT